MTEEKCPKCHEGGGLMVINGANECCDVCKGLGKDPHVEIAELKEKLKLSQDHIFYEILGPYREKIKRLWREAEEEVRGLKAVIVEKDKKIKELEEKLKNNKLLLEKSIKETIDTTNKLVKERQAHEETKKVKGNNDILREWVDQLQDYADNTEKENIRLQETLEKIKIKSVTTFREPPPFWMEFNDSMLRDVYTIADGALKGKEKNNVNYNQCDNTGYVLDPNVENKGHLACTCQRGYLLRKEEDKSAYHRRLQEKAEAQLRQAQVKIDILAADNINCVSDCEELKQAREENGKLEAMVYKEEDKANRFQADAAAYKSGLHNVLTMSVMSDPISKQEKLDRAWKIYSSSTAGKDLLEAHKKEVKKLSNRIKVSKSCLSEYRKLGFSYDVKCKLDRMEKLEKVVEACRLYDRRDVGIMILETLDDLEKK